MRNLYDRLLAISRNDVIPMHMPGHKRNRKFLMKNPYEFDITEIEGTDDLHHPEGILKEEMEKAARLYGADKTFFLVGGSTSGILIAVSACCRINGHILMARNCHKSVYHAAYLMNLKQSYLLPEFDEKTGIAGPITLEMVKRSVKENPNVSCVVITSPTYEGVVSQVREIAEFLQEQKIPLIVDEAHGAHLHFQNAVPESAVDAGADLVIQSLHKTLPALTQTGLLHVNDNGLVQMEDLIHYERIYQSTSPSYVLMASISQCLSFLEQEKESFLQYDMRLRSFYDKMGELKYIKLFECSNRDIGKVIVTTDRMGISGKDLVNRLREEFLIETEMCQGRYCVVMTTVADSDYHFDKLEEALIILDREVAENPERKEEDWEKAGFDIPKTAMTAYDASKSEKVAVGLMEAAGRIAAEYVYLYPPGIPFLVPGERITSEIVTVLLEYQKRGFVLKGLKDTTGQTMLVVL